MMNMILLNTQYYGSIQYFTKLLLQPEVYIDQYEHYERASLHNRCYIATTNGILALSVPLENGRQQRRAIKDVRIAYHHAWQRQHWHSIVSAYRSSPYFEYFETDFQGFYEQRFEFLLDFNQAILQTLLRLLRLKTTILLTENYQKHIDKEDTDYRHTCYTKAHYQANDPHYQPPTYHQVFSANQDFAPNMSIIDLLFNTGIDSFQYLQNAILKLD
ncbi:MAG: WbqC family protein [Chitinophagales bacterium]|nr:WbqC family protein [Chitinophagales bacterium]